ncbi:hypothetical protein RJ640_007672 [Escallonia rubra]|uniref:Uncharacterized protein n=1 Tax=Escallonia rubra TaxID=112253 RepID=A0AA88QP44_9ASTE|nr:hypothetical protein RJ640_007672 [Escallonia rubra]
MLPTKCPESGGTMRLLMSAGKHMRDGSRDPRIAPEAAMQCFQMKQAVASKRLGLGTCSLAAMALRPSTAVALKTILFVTICTCCSDKQCTGGPAELDGLVSLLRKALDRLKDKFVPGLEGPELYEAMSQSIQEIHGYASIRNANPYVFNNWFDMDLTEVDLGWGKPAWVSFIGGASRYKNVTFLLDGAKEGDIDACVTLDQREMDVLEADPEFLAFATLNLPIMIST